MRLQHKHSIITLRAPLHPVPGFGVGTRLMGTQTTRHALLDMLEWRLIVTVWAEQVGLCVCVCECVCVCGFQC